MATKKVVKKTKSQLRKKSSSGNISYAVEHDFIIITGGAFVVLFLVIVFFLGF
jgi:hypothetical protein